ncbi:MAG: Fur family transcriptional regulator [Burkholderiaceae bacterium]
MERSTRQNAAIRRAIAEAGRPLSPAEVLEAARGEVAALGIATVYRNLKALLDEGAVQVVTLPGEVARYEIAHHDHHHHFRCDACQRVFDVHRCPGDLAALAPPGFSVDRHEITLYGRCADCRRATPGAKRPPAREATPQRAAPQVRARRTRRTVGEA